MAAQEQALSTSSREARVYRSRQDPRCRLCKDSPETSPAHSSRVRDAGWGSERHNQVAGIVYRNICAEYGFEAPKSRWDPPPREVREQQSWDPVGLQISRLTNTCWLTNQTQCWWRKRTEDASSDRCGNPSGRWHQEKGAWEDREVPRAEGTAGTGEKPCDPRGTGSIRGCDPPDWESGSSRSQVEHLNPLFRRAQT